MLALLVEACQPCIVCNGDCRVMESRCAPARWTHGQGPKQLVSITLAESGHLVGKRPANWTDRTIDSFDLEIRIVAVNLARWLALAQTAQGSAVGLRSVHVVGIDGRDRMVVLGWRPPDRPVAASMDAVRGILDKDPNAPEVLGRLLEEYIHSATAAEHNQ